MYMAGMYGSLVHLHLPTELCRFTSWQARPFSCLFRPFRWFICPAKCEKYELRGKSSQVMPVTMTCLTFTYWTLNFGVRT